MSSLKNLLDGEFIPTDDWKAIEFDGLDDLEFKLAGVYSMEFEYDDTFGGDKKQLFIEVKKRKKGNWIVKISKRRGGEKKPVVKEFKTYKAMLDFIHAIFQKS